MNLTMRQVRQLVLAGDLEKREFEGAFIKDRVTNLNLSCTHGPDRHWQWAICVDGSRIATIQGRAIENHYPLDYDIKWEMDFLKVYRYLDEKEVEKEVSHP